MRQVDLANPSDHAGQPSHSRTGDARYFQSFQKIIRRHWVVPSLLAGLKDVITDEEGEGGENHPAPEKGHGRVT